MLVRSLLALLLTVVCGCGASALTGSPPAGPCRACERLPSTNWHSLDTVQCFSAQSDAGCRARLMFDADGGVQYSETDIGLNGTLRCSDQTVEVVNDFSGQTGRIDFDADCRNLRYRGREFQQE